VVQSEGAPRFSVLPTEYGLLIATIAIVVLVATAAFGSQISAWFNRLAGRITTTAT